MMDRGYLAIKRLLRLHAAGSCFITREKSNRKDPVDRTIGLVCDQAFDTPLRRIRCNDPKTGKRLYS